MTDLTFLKSFESFAHASKVARWAASRFREEVEVRQVQESWHVLVPTEILYAATLELDTQGARAFSERIDKIIEDERAEAEENVVQYVSEAQDGWARSEEDGWYYPDED